MLGIHPNTGTFQSWRRTEERLRESGAQSELGRDQAVTMDVQGQAAVNTRRHYADPRLPRGSGIRGRKRGGGLNNE